LTTQNGSKLTRVDEDKATRSLGTDSASGQGISESRSKVVFNKASAMFHDDESPAEPKFYTNEAITRPSEYKKTYPVGARILSKSG
jgi:hypothetical protein